MSGLPSTLASVGLAVVRRQVSPMLTFMGMLVHDSTGSGIAIEDRTLKHLPIVMMNKLRRGEPFMFQFDSMTAARATAASGSTTLSLSRLFPWKQTSSGQPDRGRSVDDVGA